MDNRVEELAFAVVAYAPGSYRDLTAIFINNWE
jgi:hypothetical protein